MQKPSKRFQQDLKRCEKRGYDMEFLKTAVRLLAADGKLPAVYRPHKLLGNYAGC